MLYCALKCVATVNVACLHSHSREQPAAAASAAATQLRNYGHMPMLFMKYSKKQSADISNKVLLAVRNEARIVDNLRGSFHL